MRNKYKGICYKCNKEVAVGAGHFERDRKGGWRVQHAEHAKKIVENWSKEKRRNKFQEDIQKEFGVKIPKHLLFSRDK